MGHGHLGRAAAASIPTPTTAARSAYISLASQKNHLALYLMGLNSESSHEQWFRKQYAERGMKLDMGKSCVRFRTLEEVPLDVIGEAVARVPVAEFVALYESSRRGR